MWEADTWDSVTVIRSSAIKADHSFEADRLPTGTFTVTAAQFASRGFQSYIPVRQVSKEVQLREGHTTQVDFEWDETESRQ